jgi:hypothetical protein
MSAGERTHRPRREHATLRLSKGRHTWFFRYTPEDEGVLRSALAELARDPRMPFDWFDAALVTHQLSSRLKPGLNRVDGPVSEFADPPAPPARAPGSDEQVQL